MSSIPLIKLVSLTVKTISKPIAKQIKNGAKKNKIFRKICIGTGNTKHRVIYYYNKIVKNNTKSEFKPMNESHSIDIGSEILGESIIYIVGIGIYAGEAEYNKAKKKKEIEEKRLLDEKQNTRLVRIEKELGIYKEENQNIEV